MKSREKKELPMDIHARPCNMASEGNNIFSKTSFGKSKRGVWNISDNPANKLAQMYTHSYTYITSRVKGSHHFRVQNDPKIFFYGQNHFQRGIFNVLLQPFQGAKVGKRHKKWSFPLRISSVNMTKSAGICGFGHIY